MKETELITQIEKTEAELKKLKEELRKEQEAPKINSFEVGDVFKRNDARLVVLSTGYGSDSYYIAGLDNTLEPYSNEQGIPSQRIMEYLSGRGYKKIGNLKTALQGMC